MTAAYAGPLRGEPLPLEFHNTLYADAGRPVDGLADGGLAAWLTAMEAALPVPAAAVTAERLPDFLRLRAAVRGLLEAALDGVPPPPAAVEAVNAASRSSPTSLVLGAAGVEAAHHGATAADVVLGAIAAETIELVGTHAADRLRACGAPGCVLMFLKDHPRREWCSAACGNRARQARHYARTRRGGP